MDALRIMQDRHAVRKSALPSIEDEKRKALMDCASECNEEGHLHLQPIFDDPDVFTSGMAHYGSFEGVNNYIALVGAKAVGLDERCGYHGERLVLLAQELGLNTCWVVLTYGKRAVTADIEPGEKILGVIALGYGQTQGVAHKSKPAEKLYDMPENAPGWYASGVEGATLAPTAMNQQKFRISLEGDTAYVTCGFGPNTKLDLGIVRHDFETASGHELKVRR